METKTPFEQQKGKKGRNQKSVKARMKREWTKIARGCMEKRDDQIIGKSPQEEREKTVMACFSQTIYIKKQMETLHSHLET